MNKYESFCGRMHEFRKTISGFWTSVSIMNELKHETKTEEHVLGITKTRVVDNVRTSGFFSSERLYHFSWINWHLNY